MSLDNNILKLISKYLRREETGEDRRALYQWYDELSEGKSIEKKSIARSYRRNRERLAAEIGGMSVRQATVRPLWYRVAAVAMVIIVGYFTIKYFRGSEKMVPVQLAELEKIVPVSNKVIITLSTGKTVDPDTLSAGKSVTIGNAIVQKDSTGHLLYKADMQKSAENVMSTVQTPKGTQYSIELSDGTKVFLNAKSRLSFPGQFGTGDRVVQLSGEAYFEVTKTLKHSKFIVKTDKQSIQVLGTKFNVKAYADAPLVKTTLAEGSVRITPKNKAIKPLIIKPDQQAILSDSDIASEEIDAQQVIAWKDGFFVFDGSNTEEVIREIGQWYGIEVDYKLGNKPVKYAGKIPKNISMARLVKLLSYADINVQAFKDKNDQLKLIVN
ncbi:FecR family protein [Mucilaginibacter paludis]|uniref:Anti-FecI sigma factor, FecR n=1 Tax=Mucilaginibacter paludis DSM 18603 TaxID=714943 RepID=H1YE48_9SPHI|nr:FecR family protein [Mucilaginibacter paludis]EHQ25226.1 anti-FecI sigma factor, FecR [Mucilaginibacter paludis DSM 18603]